MVRIVTDSAANLPEAFVSQYDITVVPLKVHIGKQTYREGIDLTEDKFFDLLAQANPLPTTSQPSPAEFEEVYRPMLEQGDEIVSVHLSGPLSGTYNSAANGMQMFPDAPISVVDSLSVSAGTALMVLAAARMARAGRSRQEIVAQIEKSAGEVLLVLTPDTLEYLKKGGRIGGAQAFLGGLLKVKPIIVIRNGRLEPGERARSRRKAIEQLVEMEVSRFGDQPVWVGLAQAKADDVGELAELARKRLNVQELIQCDIGPVVATHAGPGVLGIAVIPAPTI